MDQKTRDLRRRNKALAGKRGTLPEFEARGVGRKNKPAETFPLKRCEYSQGAVKITFSRYRKTFPYDKYMLSILKGGTRCPNTAKYGKYCCSEHKKLRDEQMNGVA